MAQVSNEELKAANEVAEKTIEAAAIEDPKDIELRKEKEAQIRKIVSRAPTPQDAVNSALNHALQNQQDAASLRYLWNPDGDIEVWKALNYSVNMVMSHTPLPVDLPTIENRKLIVLDLRVLAPNIRDGVAKDYQNLLAAWDLMSLDEPYFLTDAQAITQEVQVVTVTADKTDLQIEQKVLSTLSKGQQAVFVESRDTWILVNFEGKQGFLRKNDVILQKSISPTPSIKKVRTWGPHVFTQGNQLSQITQSSVPIVRADWFLSKILTSVDGGLYYQFRGVTTGGNGGTDLDNFLKKLGSNLKEVENLRSDQKAAIFTSNVTGKPRAVLVVQGQGTQPGVNQGLIMITQDSADKESDPDKHPIKTLINNKFDALEVIAEMPNGLHLFAIFDGKGGLQNEVPPNIASDRSVPKPHTTRLQVPISCIKCHSGLTPDGLKEEGIKHVENDVLDLMRSEVQVLGDRRTGFSSISDIDRAYAMYSGDLQKPFMRARNDLSDATLRITKSDSITDIHNKIGNIYDEYNYSKVTPKVACYELGFRVESDAEAVDVLRMILPPLPAGPGSNVFLEDVFIATLKYKPDSPRKNFKSLNRLEWEKIYGDAVTRVSQSLSNDKK